MSLDYRARESSPHPTLSCISYRKRWRIDHKPSIYRDFRRRKSKFTTIFHTKIHLTCGGWGIENYIAFQSFSGSRSPTLSNSESKGRVMNCGEGGRGKLRYEYKPKSTIYHTTSLPRSNVAAENTRVFPRVKLLTGEGGNFKMKIVLPGGSAVFNDIRIKIQQDVPIRRSWSIEAREFVTNWKRYF